MATGNEFLCQSPRTENRRRVVALHRLPQQRHGVVFDPEQQPAIAVALNHEAQTSHAFDWITGASGYAVMADGGYGSKKRFRKRPAGMGLQRVVGGQGSMMPRGLNEGSLPPEVRDPPARSAEPTRCREPVGVVRRASWPSRQAGTLRRATWREGSSCGLEPREERWPLARRPRGAIGPRMFWLANQQPETTRMELV